MNIGINYIGECDTIYQYLIQNGYINTLKFPGKHCNNQELACLCHILEKTNANMDLHGLPGMIPAISSKRCTEEIQWDKISFSKKNIKRMSTHMGIENRDRLVNYSESEILETLQKNKKKLAEGLESIVGHSVEIGLENIPGGFDFDLKTITPAFIDENWEQADFGVFDISHAKLAADTLNISYKEYLSKIKNTDKVKILHVSGNIDESNQWAHKPDKHVLIHQTEIKDILEALEIFPNVDLVVSEYAFCSKYRYEKELLIEVMTLYVIVTMKKEEIAKQALVYLEKHLKEDGTNIEELLQSYIWQDIVKGQKPKTTI